MEALGIEKAHVIGRSMGSFAPTLVVTGTEDVIAPPENAFILAQNIKA
jgi:pimeloyl-ACP methyl ester carboxylesterase